MKILTKLTSLKQKINTIKSIQIFGTVSAVKGITVEVKGLSSYASIGSRCIITKSSSSSPGLEIHAEVVSLIEDKVILLPFAQTTGIAIGNKVVVSETDNNIFPSKSWRGRVLNAFGKPIDEKGLLENGDKPYPINSEPLNPQKRRRLGQKLDLGVKVLDCFTTCCTGQRMGIFAGSGVGKSVLISMITKYSSADIKVIGLIGERGREVQEFIQEYLGEDGLKNSIIVVSTSDEPALMRKRAAYLTMTIAEYFRDQGKEVLCIMDSITRLAMAQREIGLATGEPPTTKAYTPSVFSELPKLLERAGPGIETLKNDNIEMGNITGIFTILVEGDDQNEPISDCVRGTIDGHIVLDRVIYERGRYPAVDVLRSISRSMPKCHNDWENNVIRHARRLLSVYNDMGDMIRLGAYKKGADTEVDNAIRYCPLIEEFIRQLPSEYSSYQESFIRLAEILEIPKA